MYQCLNSYLKGSPEAGCLQYMASKALGYAIIFFSFILKVPQIRNMIKLKTDKGLSYVSTYSEILTFLFSALYSYHNGNPFSTYGENVIVLIQTLIVLFLSWSYSEVKGSYFLRFLFLVSLISFATMAVLDIVIPPRAWMAIGSSTIFLVSISRFSQITYSFRTKYTGSLSAFTFLLNIGGGLARVFTTITETKDPLLIMTYSYSIFLNSIVLIQIFMYGSNKGEVHPEKKKQ